MNAFHRGGYAYRLCGPVEKGKEWMVNEQCFRDGHLKFVGKTQIQSTTRITEFLVVDKSSVILVKRPKFR